MKCLKFTSILIVGLSIILGSLQLNAMTSQDIYPLTLNNDFVEEQMLYCRYDVLNEYYRSLLNCHQADTIRYLVDRMNRTGDTLCMYLVIRNELAAWGCSPFRFGPKPYLGEKLHKFLLALVVTYLQRVALDIMLTSCLSNYQQVAYGIFGMYHVDLQDTYNIFKNKLLSKLFTRYDLLNNSLLPEALEDAKTWFNDKCDDDFSPYAWVGFCREIKGWSRGLLGTYIKFDEIDQNVLRSCYLLKEKQKELRSRILWFIHKQMENCHTWDALSNLNPVTPELRERLQVEMVREPDHENEKESNESGFNPSCDAGKCSSGANSAPTQLLQKSKRARGDREAKHSESEYFGDDEKDGDDEESDDVGQGKSKGDDEKEREDDAKQTLDEISLDQISLHSLNTNPNNPNAEDDKK